MSLKVLSYLRNLILTRIKHSASLRVRLRDFRLSRTYSSCWRARRLHTSSISSLVLWKENKQNIIFIVILETSSTVVFHQHYTVVDPELKLRGGGRRGGSAVLFCLACRLFFLLWCLLSLPKIRGVCPPNPSPRSATATQCYFFLIFYLQSTWPWNAV